MRTEQEGTGVAVWTGPAEKGGGARNPMEHPSKSPLPSQITVYSIKAALIFCRPSILERAWWSLDNTSTAMDVVQTAEQYWSRGARTPVETGTLFITDAEPICMWVEEEVPAFDGIQ